MLQEGIYTLSDLRAVLKESDAKNEFEPVLGNGVEKDNKKNNGEAVKDITDKVGKYNGERMEHTVVTPVDRNKTTLDVVWNELEPGKEWKDRADAQVGGYPSVDNKKNTDVKDNGGLDYKGNEEFLKNREKLQKDWKGTVKDDMDAGLKGRELKKYNTVNEDHTVANNTMSGGNEFSANNKTFAGKFTHDGADAYYALKDQDKMRKSEKAKKYRDNKNLDKINSKNLGLNKDINEEFDPEDDYMTTPDIVAKDFIKWATSEADKAPYPINAMQMIYDAYVNKDQEALEDVATAYFEAKYTDMAQWDTVMKGVEKAVNAFGYYNLSNEEELNASETDSMTDSENNDTMGSQIDNNNGEDEIKEPEPLDENKKNNSKGNMKRIHFKKTTFLTESQMFNQIPETFKTNGNRFYVKDASGTEYLLECTVDEKFDLPKLSVVSKLNEGKTNSEIDRMKQLFGYESSNYFTKANKGGENMSNLHEQIEKVKELEKVND